MSSAIEKRDDLIDNLRSRLRSERDRLKTEGRKVLRTAGSLGTGYALGMAEAKWGRDALAGMNIHLGVGALASGAALLGIGGDDVAEAASVVGNTALGVYGYTKGFEHQEAREAEGGDE